MLPVPRIPQRNRSLIAAKNTPPAAASATLANLVNLEQLIQIALDRHRRGNLAEAEQIYRQILEHMPDQPEALQYLGVIEAPSEID